MSDPVPTVLTGTHTGTRDSRTLLEMRHDPAPVATEAAPIEPAAAPEPKEEAADAPAEEEAPPAV